MQVQLFNTLSRQRQYKYPLLFLGLFLTCMLATVCLANRITQVGSMLEPGGIFTFPITFSICDIVSEVYGYAYPRLFIWIGIIAEMLFFLIVITVSHLPTPEFFTASAAYQTVFDPTFRYVCSGLAGLCIGEFANIYILAKLKILTKGKQYIIRSLISAAIGQALLTVVVDLTNYIGKMSTNDLIHMMYYGYYWKMVCAVIMVFPAWLIIKHLKKIEKVDYFDVNTNFNPFIFSLNDEQHKKKSILDSDFDKSTENSIG